MQSKPNVVFILTDDMGYGDAGAYAQNSKIPTPNIDKLANEGIRFTDAHASTAVCTPSRYGILTGRYCWRSWLKSQVLWSYDPPLIEEETATLGHLYRNSGYDTACIGKWHLGMQYTNKDGSLLKVRDENYNKLPDNIIEELLVDVDFEKGVTGGPTDRGFDMYSGCDVPNLPPYVWFNDNQIEEIPTVFRTFKELRHKYVESSPGIASKNWSLEKVSERITQEAVDYIHEHAKTPFFLYLPLTGPHTPVLPTKRFQGMSGAGDYGDYVCMMDWTVGSVMQALDETGVADNTIVVFTSDNGPERTAYARIQECGHYSMGEYRGIKRDSWEGGHRVPMIMRWPQEIKAGQISEQTISLLDSYATSLDILGLEKPVSGGEDSLSFLPALYGKPIDRTPRDGIVYHSAKGNFSLRQGDWVYIDSDCGGDNAEPDWYMQERGYVKNTLEKELYNLKIDPMQKDNLYEINKEKAMQMQELLNKYKIQNTSLN